MLVYFISYTTFAEMKVVITSATDSEILQIREQIVSKAKEEISKCHFYFHTSGVGMLASCFSILKLIVDEQPDLIIQAGIAGSFYPKYVNGMVVNVKADSIGDLGVEEEGLFKDVFDMDLSKKDAFPFSNKKLHNHFSEKYNLLHIADVNGVTVNEISTRQNRILQLKEKYDAEIETMEGAALHYCCLQTNTPFLQIRGISNRVGERNKSQWNIANALNNLTTTILSYVEILNQSNFFEAK